MTSDAPKRSSFWNSRQGLILLPLVAVLVFAGDFFSKRWALDNLQQGNMQPVLAPLIGFTLVTNTGTAFGMGQSTPAIGFIMPPLICLAIVAWIINREWKGRPLALLERLGFAMILGGACGNMYDRLVRGQVTDFLYFVFWPTFPVFNVADAMIDIGVALILMQSLGVSKHLPPPTLESDGDE